MICPKLLNLIPLIATAAIAEPRWIHIHSTDFEIYSSASEGSTRETLRYFEQVRSFFLQATGRSVSLLAYAQLGVGDRDEATKSAARLAQYSLTPEDRDRADQLKRYLDQPNPASPVPSALTEGGRPRLVRRNAAGLEEEEPGTPSVPRSPVSWLPTATGTFVELVCTGKTATIVLETDQGCKRFLIQNPASVNLVGVDGAVVQNFQCGPQKPAKIQVQFQAAGADQKIEGVVTGIYFQP